MKTYKLTFKDYCKLKGIDYRISNDASRFYDATLLAESRSQWRADDLIDVEYTNKRNN
jgi:hypothetical protein